MEKYLSGKLSESEAYAVERLLLNADFEREALEGFEQQEIDIKADLSKLNNQLENRIAEERSDTPFLWIKVAASVLILALSSYLIWDLSQSENLDTLAIANEDLVEHEIEEMADVTSTDSVKKRINTIDTPQVALADASNETRDLPSKSVSPSEPEGIIKEDFIALEPTTGILEKDNVVDIAEPQPAEIAEEVVVMQDDVDAEQALQGRAAGVTMVEESSSNMARKSKKESSQFPEKIAVSGLKGEIVSAEDGSALPGVNVVVKGTTIGTVTDTDGKFNIDSMPAESKELLISFIGLKTQEVAVDSQSFLTIRLEADEQQLSEVVVTAKGVEREKRALGYAVDRDEEPNRKALPMVTGKEYEQYLTDSIRYNNRSTDRGQVRLKFDVNKNGSLSNFEIDKSLGEWQDQEAIRLIKEGPAWKPAFKNGNPQKERVKVTIKFKSK